MVEADLGDESYGASGAGDDDNGDFGAEGEFEGFDQYGEGNEFDDSMGAAGGSGAAADGKESSKDLQHRGYLSKPPDGVPNFVGSKLVDDYGYIFGKDGYSKAKEGNVFW